MLQTVKIHDPAIQATYLLAIFQWFSEALTKNKELKRQTVYTRYNRD